MDEEGRWTRRRLAKMESAHGAIKLTSERVPGALTEKKYLHGGRQVYISKPWNIGSYLSVDSPTVYPSAVLRAQVDRRRNNTSSGLIKPRNGRRMFPVRSR